MVAATQRWRFVVTDATQISNVVLVFASPATRHDLCRCRTVLALAVNIDTTNDQSIHSKISNHSLCFPSVGCASGVVVAGGGHWTIVGRNGNRNANCGKHQDLAATSGAKDSPHYPGKAKSHGSSPGNSHPQQISHGRR